MPARRNTTTESKIYDKVTNINKLLHTLQQPQAQKKTLNRTFVSSPNQKKYATISIRVGNPYIQKNTNTKVTFTSTEQLDTLDYKIIKINNGNKLYFYQENILELQPNYNDHERYLHSPNIISSNSSIQFMFRIYKVDVIYDIPIILNIYKNLKLDDTLFDDDVDISLITKHIIENIYNYIYINIPDLNKKKSGNVIAFSHEYLNFISNDMIFHKFMKEVIEYIQLVFIPIRKSAKSYTLNILQDILENLIKLLYNYYKHEDESIDTYKKRLENSITSNDYNTYSLIKTFLEQLLDFNNFKSDLRKLLSAPNKTHANESYYVIGLEADNTVFIMSSDFKKMFEISDTNVDRRKYFRLYLHDLDSHDLHDKLIFSNVAKEFFIFKKIK